MKTSHFKLADKMGYKSPFEESPLRKDWQEKREREEDKIKYKEKSFHDDFNEKEDIDFVIKHTVQKGDTYSKIVKLYPQNNLTPDLLQLWNGYEPTQLPIGAILLVCDPLDVPDKYIDAFESFLWQQCQDSPFVKRTYVDGLSVVVCDDNGIPEIDKSKFQEHLMGASLVSQYNALKRSQYINKCANTARNYLSKYDASPQWELVEEAVDARNKGRTLARKSITPGARVLSEKLDQERSLKSLVAKYNKPNMSRQELGKIIISKSGSTNKALLVFNKFTRVAGPIGLAYSTYSAYSNIKDEGYETKAITGEIGSIIGSSIGFDLGTAIGAAGVVAAAALAGLTAPAWAIILGGALIGIGLGMAFAWIGRNTGRWFGSLFE